MATKAISFLGLGKYTETTYQYRDMTCTTPFMAEATAHFFREDIEALLVLVTAEALEQNFPALTQRFPGPLKPTPVSIPSGKNEQELWHIFSTIGEQIKENDTVIFDITNAFRSIPLLTFLAIAYVRTIRNAKVSHMIYGAYEARSGDQTPVFELTPFLALLDWTTATDSFLKYGRADHLADLVQHTGTVTGASSEAMSKLADRLKNLTAALQTSRPSEVV